MGNSVENERLQVFKGPFIGLILDFKGESGSLVALQDVISDF